MIVVRLLYMIWLVGAIVVLSRGLSQILFGSGRTRPAQFVRAIFMAAVWPIAVATPEGRAALRALSRND